MEISSLNQIEKMTPSNVKDPIFCDSDKKMQQVKNIFQNAMEQEWNKIGSSLSFQNDKEYQDLKMSVPKLGSLSSRESDTCLSSNTVFKNFNDGKKEKEVSPIRDIRMESNSSIKMNSRTLNHSKLINSNNISPNANSRLEKTSLKSPLVRNKSPMSKFNLINDVK